MTSTAKKPESPATPDKIELLPVKLVASLRESHASFAEGSGGENLLLIRVQDDEDLVAGLDSAGPGTQRVKPNATLHVFDYATYVGVSTPPSAADAAIALHARLLKSRHFVSPLRKKKSSAFADRITVGRSRTQDITLRHRSVSKHHTWFETDASGIHYVGDAGSTNGVQVGGGKIAVRELVEIPLGAEIVIGGVTMVIVTNSDLWRGYRAG